MEETKKPNKLTYEELTDKLTQVLAYNKQLEKAYMEQNVSNTVQRLVFLFKVIELKNTEVFNNDFITKCAKEIEEALIIDEKEESKNK